LITVPPNLTDPDLMRDDAFSQRGTRGKKNAVIIKEGVFPPQ
jgi:hypothetical protein